MSLALLKLSGDSVHDYATISDDSPRSHLTWKTVAPNT